MSGLSDLLNSDTGKSLIEGTSQQLGMDPAAASKALGSAMPLILGAMKNNASSPNGAAGLLKALGNSNHNGGILDNLGSILGGSNIDDNVMSDGAGILGHIFGGQQNNAANVIGKSNGINTGQAMNLLKVAAPVLMGMLGKKALSNKVSDQNGINDILGGLLGGDNDAQQDMASKVQDFDNNDVSIDDLAGMVLKNNKSSGLLGGILGNLFK